MTERRHTRARRRRKLDSRLSSKWENILEFFWRELPIADRVLSFEETDPVVHEGALGIGKNLVKRRGADE
jgi:hypothetical protein